jgi:hypothetical protein
MGGTRADGGGRLAVLDRHDVDGLLQFVRARA